MIGLITLLFVSFWRFLSRKEKESIIVMNEFYDLRNYLFEKMDDPTMFGYKWRELMPICRFADERFRKFHRKLDFEFSCEALLLQIIESEEIEEYGASA